MKPGASFVDRRELDPIVIARAQPRTCLFTTERQLATLSLRDSVDLGSAVPGRRLSEICVRLARPAR